MLGLGSLFKGNASSSEAPKKVLTNKTETMRKREVTRFRLASEILSTERLYVASLQTCADVWLTPLEQAIESGNEVLSQKSLQAIFSTIRLILDFHKQFLVDMEAVIDGWGTSEGAEIKSETSSSGKVLRKEGVGALFKAFAPFLKMYTQYVNNHEICTRSLNEVESKKKSKWVALNDKALSDPRTKGLNLASYLIMPVQRVPRYILLLRELIKNTESTHFDYEDLASAHTSIDKVAQHINEALRTQLNQASIVELQDKFSHNIDFLKPGRLLVHQEQLIKRGRSGDTSYQFILFSDMLCYADGKTRFKMHRELPIDHFFSVKDLDEENELMIPEATAEATTTDETPSPSNTTNSKTEYCLEIHSCEKSFIIVFHSKTVKNEWLSHLRSCIKDMHAKINSRKSIAGATVGATRPIKERYTSETICKPCNLKIGSVSKIWCSMCGGVCHSNCCKTQLHLDWYGASKRVCDLCAETARAIANKFAAEQRALENEESLIRSMSTTVIGDNSYADSFAHSVSYSNAPGYGGGYGGTISSNSTYANQYEPSTSRMSLSASPSYSTHTSATSANDKATAVMKGIAAANEVTARRTTITKPPPGTPSASTTSTPIHSAPGTPSPATPSSISSASPASSGISSPITRTGWSRPDLVNNGKPIATEISTKAAPELEPHIEASGYESDSYDSIRLVGEISEDTEINMMAGNMALWSQINISNPRAYFSKINTHVSIARLVQQHSTSIIASLQLTTLAPNPSLSHDLPKITLYPGELLFIVNRSSPSAFTAIPYSERLLQALLQWDNSTSAIENAPVGVDLININTNKPRFDFSGVHIDFIKIPQEYIFEIGPAYTNTATLTASKALDAKLAANRKPLSLPPASPPPATANINNISTRTPRSSLPTSVEAPSSTVPIRPKPRSSLNNLQDCDDNGTYTNLLSGLSAMSLKDAIKHIGASANYPPAIVSHVRDEGIYCEIGVDYDYETLSRRPFKEGLPAFDWPNNPNKSNVSSEYHILRLRQESLVALLPMSVQNLVDLKTHPVSSSIASSYYDKQRIKWMKVYNFETRNVGWVPSSILVPINPMSTGKLYKNIQFASEDVDVHVIFPQDNYQLQKYIVHEREMKDQEDKIKEESEVQDEDQRIESADGSLTYYAASTLWSWTKSLTTAVVSMTTKAITEYYNAHLTRMKVKAHSDLEFGIVDQSSLSLAKIRRATIALTKRLYSSNYMNPNIKFQFLALPPPLPTAKKVVRNSLPTSPE